MLTEEALKAPFPYDCGNILNDMFFTWIFPLVNFYRKNNATEFNIYDLPNRLEYQEDLKMVRKEWERIKMGPKPNIFYAVWPVFKKRFFIAVLPGTISYNCNLVNAVMQLYIIDYMRGEINVVAPYIVIYALSVAYNIISNNFSGRSIIILIAKLKACFTEIIFEKTLNTHYSEIAQGSQSGKITSLISADLEFLEGMIILPLMFSFVFLIIGAGILLWFNLGVAGVIGLLVTILHLPLILWFGKMFGKIRFVTAKIGDSRMKMITNLIEGIRIVKLYGWESSYLDAIFERRGQEIRQLKRKAIISSIYKAINLGSMGLMLFVTFAVYIALGNKLNPSTAFSSITILLVCNSMINIIGTMGAAQIFLIKASFTRITEALLIKDKDKKDEKRKKGKYSITMENCKFVWNKKENIINEESLIMKGEMFTLRGISMKVKKGELVIVIGAVGSGKTALFLGLLNEIYLEKGKIDINGELAIASEEPWIVSGTIKENIISDQVEDAEFYNEIIEKCCLEKDLELFKDYGDETMVGDRGITLSGGQKARVALARAVYANRDIILLDDPLSAVDPEVCFNLFNNCIRGILKEKTVILATHQSHFVSQADKILILDEGRQIFFGNYEELVDQGLMGYLGKMKQAEEEEKKEEVKIEVKKMKNN